MQTNHQLTWLNKNNLSQSLKSCMFSSLTAGFAPFLSGSTSALLFPSTGSSRQPSTPVPLGRSLALILTQTHTHAAHSEVPLPLARQTGSGHPGDGGPRAGGFPTHLTSLDYIFCQPPFSCQVWIWIEELEFRAHLCFSLLLKSPRKGKQKAKPLVTWWSLLYALTFLYHPPFQPDHRYDGTIENLSKNHWTATRGQSPVSTSWTQPFGKHSRTSVLELSKTWNVLTQNTAKCSIRGAYTHVTSQRSRTRVCVNVHVCNTYDFICVGLVVKHRTSFQMFWYWIVIIFVRTA